MDFKTQIIQDLSTFHNPGEFAEMTNIWYCGSHYTVPAVMDHVTVEDRKKTVYDHGEGINKVEALLYISMSDLGFVPQKGQSLEMEQAGDYILYNIVRSNCEDGEIILELGAFDE